MYLKHYKLLVKTIKQHDNSTLQYKTFIETTQASAEYINLQTTLLQLAKLKEQI